MFIRLQAALAGFWNQNHGRRTTEEAQPPVRDAGPEAMKDPPTEWDHIDEAADESFPASDPPGGY
ncbi:hypothetical protein [Hyphomonas sp.]|uniref:hypothetical protein n=1 Tax=Hyphomonas sp. TaxID=87 RepID=UPI00345B7CEF